MAFTTCHCGRRPIVDDVCLLHTPDDRFDAAFDNLRDGAFLDLSDADVDGSMLHWLLNGLADGVPRRPRLPPCDFGNARFHGHADFARTVFTDRARFSEATFHGAARFADTEFKQTARFRDVTFHGPVSFSRSQFDRGASFVRATFAAELRFQQATINHEVNFIGATFHRSAVFAGTTFLGPTGFRDTRFEALASFAGTHLSGRISFVRAAFAELADFSRARFAQLAHFEVTRFAGTARFNGAVFLADARFVDLPFGGAAQFRGARFERVANFARATFTGAADFHDAQFASDAGFGNATFHQRSRFSGATFAGIARLDKTVFHSTLRLAGAVFEGAVQLHDAQIDGDARWQRAQFRQARTLGPLIVGGVLMADDVTFGAHVNVNVDAAVLSLRRATFNDGAHLRVARADVILEDADFLRRSTLSHLQPGHAPRAVPYTVEPGQTPRLLTLRGAHVAPLAIEDVDLRPCRFFGAHGLASLRIEATCRLPSAPPRGGSVARATIAEEHAWRAARTHGPRATARAGRWSATEVRPPPGFRDGYGHAPLSPAQIATIYRSLREARESHKDEAGAGDLYFGEMEMRRCSKGVVPADRDGDRHLGERFVLTVYWLLSGYGVRATRAFVSLALTLVGGAALLWWFGFHDPMSCGRSLIFAVESAISVLRPPDEALSAGGQVVQIALRLAGPLLFGLGLLAIRARVKR
jgi:uncharacterized protein YjbI with pentapeptide repeats